jgi:hypothetical protein
MADIRTMNFEQVEELNRNNKRMSTETKTPRTKKIRTRTSTPAYKAILDATPEDFAKAVVDQASYRSEFSKALNALNVFTPEQPVGKKVEGDFNRIRQMVSQFAKTSGKRFTVQKSQDNGYVIIKRVEPEPVAEAQNN